MKAKTRALSVIAGELHAALRHSELARLREYAGTQPLIKFGPPPSAGDVTNRDGDCLFLSNQHDQPLAAGDAGVEKVPLQHGVVLRHDGNHHSWVFRALALVDACGVSRHVGVELAQAIGDRAPVEARCELTFLRLNAHYKTDVAILDLLVIVVLDLHDLVARREGPPEPFYLAISGGIEGACNSMLRERAPTRLNSSGRENLDVADWIEAKARGMRVLTCSMMRETAVSASSASTK